MFFISNLETVPDVNLIDIKSRTVLVLITESRLIKAFVFW